MSAPARLVHNAPPLVAAITAVVLLAPAALAETAYVTDILRLGLHEASDTSDQPMRMLASGDQLEVLTKTRYYAQVRTDNGELGWVKAGYLTDEKPARAQLVELTEERDGLAQQVSSLQARLDSRVDDLANLTTQRDRLTQDAKRATDELATLRADNERLDKQVAQHRFSVRLRWVLLTAVVMLGIGLLAGWMWYDHKHRQKHGGFRI